MEQEGKSFRDYLEIVYRRKFLIIIPVILISIISGAVAMLLPASYRSEATISIERQQIPNNLVSSTVTTYADEEINVIQRRIMSTANISEIIDKYRLYPEDRGELTRIELVDMFRDQAGVRLVSADVTDPKSNRVRKAVIAFNVSFKYQQPEVAQQVVNELVSRFLSEYARNRSEVTSETAQFLADEAEKTKLIMQQMEQKLAQYKEKYSGSLPELLELNLSRIDRANQEIAEINSQRKEVEERIVFLKIELEQSSPHLNSETGLSPKDQLSSAKSELTRLLRSYTSTHPDVLRVKDEITALEKEVAEMEANGGIAEEPTNPAYKRIQNQIKFAGDELDTLEQRHNRVLAQIDELERQIALTPQVERGHQDLIRDYENISQKYNDLKSKQISAELAQTLEDEQKGESFSLLEPAQLPLTPDEPNRPKIILLGLIVAFGVGGGAAFLAETMDGSIRGYDTFAEIAGGPPIAVIPYIANQADIDRKKKSMRLALVSIAVLLFLSVVAVHLFIMPLDMLWLEVMKRLG